MPNPNQIANNTVDLPGMVADRGFVEVGGGNYGGVTQLRGDPNAILPNSPGAGMVRQFSGGEASPYANIPLRYGVVPRDDMTVGPPTARPAPRTVARPVVRRAQPVIRRALPVIRPPVRANTVGNTGKTAGQLGIRDVRNFHGRGLGIGGVTTSGNWNTGAKWGGAMSGSNFGGTPYGWGANIRPTNEFGPNVLPEAYADDGTLRQAANTQNINDPSRGFSWGQLWGGQGSPEFYSTIRALMRGSPYKK